MISVEKRRIRLNINGVVCGIITEESDEYMQIISDEVGSMMAKIMASSPVITRESAALTVALSFCDDARQTQERLQNMKRKAVELEKRALETERQSNMLKKENGQLWEETEALLNQPTGDFSAKERAQMADRIAALEAEVLLLRGKISDQDEMTAEQPAPLLRNPLKPDDQDLQGFVSFFQKDDE